MTKPVRIGDPVWAISEGIEFRGTVRDFEDGMLFLYADRPVPRRIGTQVATGRFLWIRVPGQVIRDRRGRKTGYRFDD